MCDLALDNAKVDCEDCVNQRCLKKVLLLASVFRRSSFVGIVERTETQSPRAAENGVKSHEHWYSSSWAGLLRQRYPVVTGQV